MKRGDIDFLCSRDLAAVVWCDRAPLYFLSTFDNPHQTTTVKRKDKDGAVVQVQCPLVVSSYTQYMGGCDLNDQLTKLYRCRRHYRWPRRLIMKCILWTCYNAYVLLGTLPTTCSAWEAALHVLRFCWLNRTQFDWWLPVAFSYTSTFYCFTVTRPSEQCWRSYAGKASRSIWQPSMCRLQRETAEICQSASWFGQQIYSIQRL